MLELFGNRIRVRILGNCDIGVKQKISIINEMKRNKMKWIMIMKTESLGLRKTLLNTVNFHLKFAQLSSIFHGINES
jgi:hypothetical protein